MRLSDSPQLQASFYNEAALGHSMNVPIVSGGDRDEDFDYASISSMSPVSEVAPEHARGGQQPKKIQNHRFHLSPDLVVIEAQQEIFQIPRWAFVSASPEAQRWLDKCVPDRNGNTVMRMNDVQPVDLEDFLSVLFERSYPGPMPTTKQDWTGALKLAHRWGFAWIKQRAIQELSSLTSAVDKIVLSHQYDIDVWRFDAYSELCLQDTLPSLEDYRRLGVDNMYRIDSARQAIRGPAELLDDCASILQSIFLDGPEHDLGFVDITPRYTSCLSVSNEITPAATEPFHFPLPAPEPELFAPEPGLFAPEPELFTPERETFEATTKGNKGKKMEPVTPAFEEPEPSFEPPREPAPEPIIVTPAGAPWPEPTPAEEKQEDEWFAPTVTKGKKGKKGKKGALAEPEPEPEPAPPAPSVEEHRAEAASLPEPVRVKESRPAEDEWFTPAAPAVKVGKRGMKINAFGWDQAEEPAAEPPPSAPIEPEPVVEPVVAEKAPAPEPTVAANEDLFAPAIKKGKKNQKKSPWAAPAADPEPEPTVAARPETAPPARQEPPPTPAVNEMHSEELSNAAGGTNDCFSSAQARKNKKSGKKSIWYMPNPEPAALEPPNPTSPPAISPGANEASGADEWFGAIAKKRKSTSAKSWDWATGALPAPEPEPVVGVPAAVGNEWFANLVASQAKLGRRL